jgi:tubulin alpha
MREVISVHVGQAGVQIGNACCMSFLVLLPPSFFPFVCSVLHRHMTRQLGGQNLFMWYDLLIRLSGELYTVEHGLSVSLM